MIRAAGVFLACLLAAESALAENPATLTAPSTEGEKKLVRTELFSDSEGGIRLSHLIDPLKIERNQGTASYYLFSVGREISFVQKVEIDLRNQSRHFAISTDRKNERVEFVRDGADPRLSLEEHNRRVGFLRAGDDELKIAPEDAELKSVRLRTRTILESWRPDRANALRKIYRAILGCSLPMGKGDLLPILFPDESGPRHAVACPYTFHRVEPDGTRDIQFTSIEPELGSWLKRPFGLTTKPPLMQSAVDGRP